MSVAPNENHVAVPLGVSRIFVIIDVSHQALWDHIGAKQEFFSPIGFVIINTEAILENPIEAIFTVIDILAIDLDNFPLPG